MARLLELFEDADRPLSRSGWWLGTLGLIALLAGTSALFGMLLRDPALQRGIDTFLSIAALLPAHGLNRRRLEARGRLPRLADGYAALALACMVAALFLPEWRVSAALGLALSVATLWLIVELGLMPERAKPVDAIGRRAYAPVHDR